MDRTKRGMCSLRSTFSHWSKFASLEINLSMLLDCMAWSPWRALWCQTHAPRCGGSTLFLKMGGGDRNPRCATGRAGYVLVAKGSRIGAWPPVVGLAMVWMECQPLTKSKWMRVIGSEVEGSNAGVQPSCHLFFVELWAKNDLIIVNVTAVCERLEEASMLKALSSICGITYKNTK